MPKRLVVIDGADEGRYFPLLETGSSTIGSNRRSADICLHDLYVSRIHCELEYHSLLDGHRQRLGRGVQHRRVAQSHIRLRIQYLATPDRVARPNHPHR